MTRLHSLCSADQLDQITASSVNTQTRRLGQGHSQQPGWESQMTQVCYGSSCVNTGINSMGMAACSPD